MQSERENQNQRGDQTQNQRENKNEQRNQEGKTASNPSSPTSNILASKKARPSRFFGSGASLCWSPAQRGRNWRLPSTRPPIPSTVQLLENCQ